MTQTVTVQEIIIILATQGQTPSVVNADFLQYSGIIPDDWQLARQPIYTDEVAQIAFQSNVTVTVQPNRMVVAQAIEGKPADDLAAVQIARKLASALPKVNYQAFGFNAIGYVPFPEGEESIRQYLNHTLLAQGPWQEFDGVAVEPSFEFAYNLPQGRLSLSANSATLRQREAEEAIPIVSLTGTIEHVLKQDALSERLTELMGYLDDWQTDLKTYKDLVNNYFLLTVSTGETIKEDTQSQQIEWKDAPREKFDFLGARA